MVSNQALSSISISEWNQILHLSHFLTIMVVSGFQVPVMPSAFPALSRAAVYGGAGHPMHKDTLPRD